MASLSIPAYGYGIRYDHGLFRQVVKDGWQQEYPENWLSFGNPWQFERPEVVYDIQFGGSVEAIDAARTACLAMSGIRPRRSRRSPTTRRSPAGAAGTSTRCACGRRAPSIRCVSTPSIQGDHIGALVEQVRAEAISKILYPSDETPAGQELRLRQEYFFVSASLQDLIHRHMRTYGDIRSLPDKVAIQLNDTHPAISVAELMRILVDVRDIPWDEAWDITARTLGYTNHTLLPEALETWPVPLMERLLPRQMQIIYLINAIHLEKAKKVDDADDDFLSSVSLIDEGSGRRVRMGHLAFIGSHSINGVSALHSRAGARRRSSAISTESIRAASTTRPTASPSAAGCMRPIPA